MSVRLCFKPVAQTEVEYSPPHPPLQEAGVACIAMRGWNDRMGQEERIPGVWMQLGGSLEDSPVGLLRCQEGEAGSDQPGRG